MLHTPIHAPLGSGCQRPRPSTCHLIIAPLSSTPCMPRLCPLACAPAPPYPRGLSPQPAATVAARRAPLTEV